VIRFFNSRKTMIALAVAVALVAIVVPMCRMVGCSMETGYMGFMHSGSAPGLFGDCGGEYTSTFGPAGIVPPGGQSLLLTLVAALGVAAFVFSPQRVVGHVSDVYAMPPPPPEDPRGERFRV
jgi:hypothetical protein